MSNNKQDMAQLLFNYGNDDVEEFLTTMFAANQAREQWLIGNAFVLFNDDTGSQIARRSAFIRGIDLRSLELPAESGSPIILDASAND